MLGAKRCLHRPYIIPSATRWTRPSRQAPQIARGSLPPRILQGVDLQGMHLSHLMHSPRVPTSAPSQIRPRAPQGMVPNRRRLSPKAHALCHSQALHGAVRLVMGTPPSRLSRSLKPPNQRPSRRLASGSWRTCMLPQRSMIRRVRPRPPRRRRRPVPIVRRRSPAHRTWQVSGHHGCTLGPLLDARRAQRGQQPCRRPRGDRS